MTMPDVYLVSTSHQRYENGIPVKGLQQCFRILKVQQNNGMNVKGYRLTAGDGFLFTIYRADEGVTNRSLTIMGQKPMRVIENTMSNVRFQGFDVQAQTPFGYQAIDLSCYAIDIPQNQEPSDTLVWRLYMLDRNVHIEYYFDNNVYIPMEVRENIDIIKRLN